jgi:hypothetical protein
VSDDALNIDLTELKVREIEEIEEKLGVSINEAFQGKSLGKAMRAIGWVTRKRDNPDFTWEEAGELVVKLAQPDPDPTSASG